jgi:hypothetical protein
VDFTDLDSYTQQRMFEHSYCYIFSGEASCDSSADGAYFLKLAYDLSPLGVVSDGQKCLGGSASGCGWVAVGAVPFFKFAKAESAIAKAVRLGREGEAAAGITKNTRRLYLPDGSFHIPDVLGDGVIGEVKNVAKLSYTSQLRHFASYAQKNGLRFDLYIRPGGGTQLSGPLWEAVYAGDVTLRYLP